MNRFSAGFFFVFALLFLLLFATASATTDYVDPNGDVSPNEWDATGPGTTHT